MHSVLLFRHAGHSYNHHVWIVVEASVLGLRVNTLIEVSEDFGKVHQSFAADTVGDDWIYNIAAGAPDVSAYAANSGRPCPGTLSARSMACAIAVYCTDGSRFSLFPPHQSTLT